MRLKHPRENFKKHSELELPIDQHQDKRGYAYPWAHEFFFGSAVKSQIEELADLEAMEARGELMTESEKKGIERLYKENREYNPDTVEDPALEELVIRLWDFTDLKNKLYNEWSEANPMPNPEFPIGTDILATDLFDEDLYEIQDYYPIKKKTNDFEALKKKEENVEWDREGRFIAEQRAAEIMPDPNYGDPDDGYRTVFGTAPDAPGLFPEPWYS